MGQEKKFKIVVVNAKKGIEKVNVEEFLERDFGVCGKIKKAGRQGTRGQGISVVEIDLTKAKKEFMRNTSRLGTRKVNLDNDLTSKEIVIQRKITEIAKEER